MLLHYVLLSAFVVLCDARCVFNKNLFMQCESISEIRRISDRGLQKVLIRSNNAKQGITSSTFSKFPRLKTAVFVNSVNNIEPHSFDDNLVLQYIKFENCALSVIKNSHFSRLLTVHTLEFFNSGITTLEPKCFEGSSSLSHIIMEDNSFSRVPFGVFSRTNLKTLILNRNQIEVIEQNAFTNMPNLKFLSLHGNLITTFIPTLLMGESSVEVMVISDNNIKTIVHDTSADGAFNGLTHLKHLDLSFNNLETFPEKALPKYGLPFLERLLLHNNRLNYLSTAVIQGFTKLSEVTIFANPWQCTCYKSIKKMMYRNNVKLNCAIDYLNGLRPVCVAPETGGDKCWENIANPDELYRTYFLASEEYPEVKFDSWSYCVKAINIGAQSTIYKQLLNLYKA